MTSGDSSSGFTVATERLRKHADVLDQTAATMEQAQSAAQQVTLADDAYGHLPVSTAFAGLVRLVAPPAMDALSQAHTAISSMGTALRTTADNYEDGEKANASGFTTINNEMGTYTPLNIGRNVTAVVSINSNGGTS